jgi:hypothetical protein
MSEDTEARLRPLKPRDFEAVVEIDRRITGRARRLFFEKRLEAALADSSGFVSVALEDGRGKLIGYSIARVQSGEFGEDRCAAVLDVIGVDPDSRKHRHIQFFASAGFLLAPNQVLERPTARSL